MQNNVSKHQKHYAEYSKTDTSKYCINPYIVICIFCISFYYFLFFHCCSITVVLFFPHCSPLTFPSPAPSVSPHPVVPLPWVLYTCFLTRPFPFFFLSSLSHLPFGHRQSVPYFHVSGSILLVCFVHYIPLIGENIWYLSFAAWIISIDIILSSSMLS